MKLHQNLHRGSYYSTDTSEGSLRLGGGLCIGLVYFWTNLLEKGKTSKVNVITKDERYVANFSELVERTTLANCSGSQLWLCWDHLRCWKKYIYQYLSPTHRDPEWMVLKGAKAILTCTVWSSDQWHHHNQRTVKMHIFRLHPRSTESETQPWGSTIFVPTSLQCDSNAQCSLPTDLFIYLFWAV